MVATIKYTTFNILNKYDNYLYVSDSKDNPIERINLSDLNASSWQSLHFTLSNVNCSGTLYAWVPAAGYSQAGIFVDENIFNSISRYMESNWINFQIFKTESIKSIDVVSWNCMVLILN